MKKIITMMIAGMMMISLSTAFAERNRDKEKSRDNAKSRNREEMKQKRQDWQKGQGGQHGRSIIDRFLNNPQIAEKLGLTDAQIAKLKKASEQSKAKQEKLMDAMREAGKKQAELLMADEVDRKTLKQAVQNTGKIRTEMGWLKTEEILALKEILTKEQSQTMKDMREKHRQQGDGRRGSDTKRRGGKMKRRSDEDQEPVRCQEEGGGDMFTM